MYAVLAANKCLHVAALYWVAHLLQTSSITTSGFLSVVLIWACVIALGTSLLRRRRSVGLTQARDAALKKPWKQRTQPPPKLVRFTATTLSVAWLWSLVVYPTSCCCVLPQLIRVAGNAFMILVCLGAMLHAARAMGALRTAVLAAMDGVVLSLSSLGRGGIAAKVRCEPRSVWHAFSVARVRAVCPTRGLCLLVHVIQARPIAFCLLGAALFALPTVPNEVAGRPATVARPTWNATLSRFVLVEGSTSQVGAAATHHWCGSGSSLPHPFDVLCRWFLA